MSDVVPVATELPQTAWTILGLLSFGRPLSGYDVKKWADSSLAFIYWSPAPSQIYAELRRLERRGFARSQPAPDGDGRGKRLYEITDDGTAALRAWVAAAPEPTVLKHAAMLRVWLGHLSGTDLGRVLAGHRDELRTQLAAARHAADRATAEPAWRYPAAVARWVVRRLESELELLEDLEADLADVATGRAASRG